MTNARDVIQAAAGECWPHCTQEMRQRVADAILAALDEAGLEIVERHVCRYGQMLVALERLKDVAEEYCHDEFVADAVADAESAIAAAKEPKP